MPPASSADIFRYVRLEIKINNSLFSSESTEWLTPPKIISKVVNVFGKIDLDPCADETKLIPATNHYTKIDDGLSQFWYGRVYMNPPYGREIENWIWKLNFEYLNNRTVEAIALLPARVDTEWWMMLREYPVCFIHGRLKFSGHENSAPFPSAVVYLGQNGNRFVDEFSRIGVCYSPIKQSDVV